MTPYASTIVRYNRKEEKKRQHGERKIKKLTWIVRYDGVILTFNNSHETFDVSHFACDFQMTFIWADLNETVTSSDVEWIGVFDAFVSNFRIDDVERFRWFTVDYLSEKFDFTRDLIENSTCFSVEQIVVEPKTAVTPTLYVHWRSRLSLSLLTCQSALR